MSKPKTMYNAMQHVADSLKKYNARVKAADDALRTAMDDKRVSEYGKQEALNERNEAMRIAEKTLRESIRAEKEALTISEEERTRVEVLSTENLRLLETLRAVAPTKQDFEIYARRFQAEDNITMLRALQTLARQNGYQFKYFHAVDENIANFAKVEALLDGWLRDRADKMAFSTAPIDDIADAVMSASIENTINSLLAESDPTAAHPEIEVADIPATLEEEFAQTIREQRESQETATDPQTEELIAQAFGVKSHAAERIRATAQAMADAVSLENKLEAEADKADGATAGGTADRSPKKPNKYDY